MSSFNLIQVISEPTRVVNDCSSLIDLAFVSVPGMVQSCETIPPLANSDHLGIHLIMTTKLKKKVLLDESDTDMYWSSFKHYFLQIMEICIPHVLVKTKRNVPWFNKEITLAVRKHNLLHRHAKVTKSAKNEAKYRTMRNKVVSLLRKSKQGYFDELNQADNREFWKIIMKQLNNNILHCKLAAPQLILVSTKPMLSIIFSMVALIKTVPH